MSRRQNNVCRLQSNGLADMCLGAATATFVASFAGWSTKSAAGDDAAIAMFCVGVFFLVFGALRLFIAEPERCESPVLHEMPIERPLSNDSLWISFVDPEEANAAA